MSTFAKHESILVAGTRLFSKNMWREAILFFLNGMWGGKENVVSAPTIKFNDCDFGDITLRRVETDIDSGKHPEDRRPIRNQYVAYTSGDEVLYTRNSDRKESRNLRESFGFPEHAYLEVSCASVCVDEGLMTLVRNPKVRLLGIRLYPDAYASLFLSKGDDRGEYGITGIGLYSENDFCPKSQTFREAVSWYGGRL